jgi:hypothetical protein
VEDLAHKSDGYASVALESAYKSGESLCR